MPVPVRSPNPEYTEEARDAFVGGDVVLQAIIRKDGTVRKIEIIEGLGYGLDESAVNTITNDWRFKPATSHCMPVEAAATLGISFKLKLPEADGKELIKYPLRAMFVATQWERNLQGWMVGSGYGNMKEGKSLRGFKFTCSCPGGFKRKSYAAKWKKPESRLEVFNIDLQTSTKCKLDMEMTDLIYTFKDGRLIAVTSDQWNKIQNAGSE